MGVYCLHVPIEPVVCVSWIWIRIIAAKIVARLCILLRIMRVISIIHSNRLDSSQKSQQHSHNYTLDRDAYNRHRRP